MDTKTVLETVATGSHWKRQGDGTGPFVVLLTVQRGKENEWFVVYQGPNGFSWTKTLSNFLREMLPEEKQ